MQDYERLKMYEAVASDMQNMKKVTNQESNHIPHGLPMISMTNSFKLSESHNSNKFVDVPQSSKIIK